MKVALLAIPLAMVSVPGQISTGEANAVPRLEGSVSSRADEHVARSGRRQPTFLRGVRKMAIPFGKVRKRRMAAYSKRHYGKPEWRLESPRQIVLHYADAPTVSSVFNTFAEDRPDPAFGERPNVCAHFVLGGARPVQMVSLRVRCRHALGLNHVAIGIEHLGYSDRDTMGNRSRRRASMRLVRRLRCIYDIPVRDVIGHSESLRSRYYRERVDRFKGITSPDFSRSTMRRYRSGLSKMKPCRARGSAVRQDRPDGEGPVRESGGTGC